MEDDSMRSEKPPGAKRPVRRAKAPLTIDLSPTEVATPEPAPPPEPPEPPPPEAELAPPEPPAVGASAVEPQPPQPPQPSPPPRPSAPSPPRGLGALGSGIIGGLVVLVIGILILATGLFSSGGPDLSGAVGSLDKRVAALEARNAGNNVSDLAGRVGQLEAAGKGTKASLSEVQRRLAVSPTAEQSAAGSVSRTAVDELAARVGRLEAASAAAGLAPAASDLADRIAAIEGAEKALSDKVTALAARPYGANESERAARAAAIGTLRQAAEKGGAFAGDFAMLRALGSDEADVATLHPLAEKGAPSRADLAGEFPAVADAILVASTPVDPNAGLFDRLAGFARGLVTVRPTAPIEGDTPEAVVSRMQAAVERGDLAAALAERDALPAPARTASAAWAAEAKDRLAIDESVGRLIKSVAPSGGG